ncbi:hypothetical protein X777_12835, partial [Ooceraea biroi]
VVYKIDCTACHACYIGQTKRHLKTRIKEHMSDINKHPDNLSVVSQHRIVNSHEFSWNNVNILHKEDHFKKREIAEMIFIKQSSDAINSQRYTNNLPSIYDNILTKAHDFRTTRPINSV